MNEIRNKQNVEGEVKMSNLFYDQSDKAIKNTKFKVAQKFKINTEMKKIIETIKESNIAQRQMKRRYQGKLKSARFMNEGIYKNEQVMKNLMEKRSILEKESEANMLKSEHQIREVKMLAKLRRKIRKLKLSELKDYKKTFKTQIELEKESANKETKSMMHIIMAQQKLTDFSKCFDPRLHKFKDKKFAKKLCFHYYGEYGLKSCSFKENFCNMCCDFHIGLNFPGKRYKCKKKCFKNIHPEKNFLMKEPSKKKKKERKKIKEKEEEEV